MKSRAGIKVDRDGDTRIGGAGPGMLHYKSTTIQKTNSKRRVGGLQKKTHHTLIEISIRPRKPKQGFEFHAP